MSTSNAFQFATCERGRALGFLRKLYPSSTIEDTPEDAKEVLDYVEEDRFRIPDPMMHGSRVAICQSRNWKAEDASKYVAALQKFHDRHTQPLPEPPEAT